MHIKPSFMLQKAYGFAALSIHSIPEPFLAVVDLKRHFSKGLGIIMMLAFIFGVIKVISGAIAISNGNPDGKSAILGGILVAGAGAIMMVLFQIFGMERMALTPEF